MWPSEYNQIKVLVVKDSFETSRDSLVLLNCYAPQLPGAV